MTHMNKGFCVLPFSIHLKKLGFRAPGWLGLGLGWVRGLMFGFAQKNTIGSWVGNSGNTLIFNNLTNMAGWKMDPFEDVFPIEHGDFPLSC